MLGYYFSAFKSMLGSSSRLEGRSWLGEFICRALRTILQAPENKSLPRLRKVIDSASVYHLAARKVNFHSTNFASVACLVATPKPLVATPKPKTAVIPAKPTIIVYLHGGGYVFGSPTGYKPLLAQLCINSHATVIAVDYRLAPEHPYPAPQEDCLTAVRTVFEKYQDSKKIIAGDSAGGALAIMTALALHRESLPADGCVLLSPWVDPLASQGSMISNQRNDFLTLPFLQESFQALMQDRPATEQVCFNDVDLSTLPTTLIQCASGEIFFDQIQQFANRAASAGVKLVLQNTEQQFHVFQLLSPILQDSRQAVTALSEFINALPVNRPS